MRRCRGKTKKGEKCRKNALKESHYCHIHSKQAPRKKKVGKSAIAGGIIGLVAGGIRGATMGAISGGIIGKFLEEEKMTNTRVFISFDYDHDSDLKHLFVGQSRYSDSPFYIQDWSVKEHLSGDWKEKVRRKLKSVDQVAVICGERTHTAVGVSSEITIAREVGVPYFLLKGRSDKICTRPKSAHSSDKMYDWTWANLKALVGGGR